MEKNWAPFTVAGITYAHQWLERSGVAVAVQIDVPRGRVHRRWESEAGALRAAVGVGPGESISGGAPRSRLTYDLGEFDL